jgi:uncharacterized membrane protein YciS (DUF1049 family)
VLEELKENQIREADPSDFNFSSEMIGLIVGVALMMCCCGCCLVCLIQRRNKVKREKKEKQLKRISLEVRLENTMQMVEARGAKQNNDIIDYGPTPSFMANPRHKKKESV